MTRAEGIKQAAIKLKPYLRNYLERIGVEFKTDIQFKCPFKEDHNRGDSNPSAVVCRNSTTYKCFGCGKSGDVIDLCMHLESLSFPNAVEHLADIFGIEIGGESVQTTRNSFLDRVAAYIIHEGNTKIAEERHIPQKICKSYGIGTVSRSSIENLSHNFGREELLSSGIWGKSRKDDSLYLQDMFGVGYITFILRDEYRNVIGMSGRRTNGKEPKYMDPIGNHLGGKEVLYPIDKSIPYIRRNKEAILVEGYTDAIQMHLINYRQSLAIRCGIPTVGQINNLITLGVNRIVLMLDNDKTGRTTTISLLEDHYEKMKYPEIDFSVIEYPKQHKDPDEFIRACGRDIKQIANLINTTDGLQYYIRNKTYDNQDDINTMHKLMNICTNHLRGSISISLYAKTLSKRFDVEKDIIAGELISKQITTSKIFRR